MLFLFVAGAFADDEVKLKNGDRLTGSVKGLVGGKLLLETKHSGPLKIDWAEVASVKTDAPIKVKLSTGELLEGKLAPGADGRLKIETVGPAAPVEVDLPKVMALNEPPVVWHGTLGASLKATDGNTHTTSYLLAGEGVRESDLDQILLRAIWRSSKQGSVLIERNAYGIVKYSYKFTPKFYGYLSEELLSDRFKDLRLESITSIGVGYQWVKEDWIDFATEGGLAYFSNDFRVAKDESHMGARLAAKLRVALPLGFEFKDMFTIYPNFEESQDFQIRNEATLGTLLGGGWTLLGGVITEYDRTPTPGLRRHDDTYFAGLGYKF
jgi:hypothetical protein